MPFLLSAMEEKDIPECADVDEAAMVDWPYAQAHQRPPFSRKDLFIHWIRKEWGQNPNHNWIKIIDTDTGEMAAAAWWQFEIETDRSEKVDKPDGQGVADVNIVETGAGDPKFPKIWIETGRRWEEFKNEFIGDQSHAILSLLITHPKYQRRGAGSMLVKWGCDRADELNIISAVHASEVGLRVYTKHGFEVMKTSEFDLRPYGVEATEVRRGMIRWSKSRLRSSDL